MTYPSNISRMELFKFLSDRCTLDELRLIAFTVGAKYTDLAGETQTAKAISLVEYAEHRTSEASLIAAVREVRPDAFPPPAPASSPGTPAPAEQGSRTPHLNIRLGLDRLRDELRRLAPYTLTRLDELAAQLPDLLPAGENATPTVRQLVGELNQLSYRHLGTTFPEVAGAGRSYQRGSPLRELAQEAEHLWQSQSLSAERTRTLEGLVELMHYAAGFTPPHEFEADIPFFLEQVARLRGDALAAVAWLQTFPDSRFIDEIIHLIERNEQPFITYHATLALTTIVRHGGLDESGLRHVATETQRLSNAVRRGDDRAAALRRLDFATKQALQAHRRAIIAVNEFEAYDSHGPWPAGVNQHLILGTLTEATIAALRDHLRIHGEPVTVQAAARMSPRERADILVHGRVNVYEVSGAPHMHIRLDLPGPEVSGRALAAPFGGVSGEPFDGAFSGEPVHAAIHTTNGQQLLDYLHGVGEQLAHWIAQNIGDASFV